MLMTATTGLVLELPSHKNECATKYLTLKGFYILVEKTNSHLSWTARPQWHGTHTGSQYVPLLTSPATDSKGTTLGLQRNGPPFSSQGTEVPLVKLAKEEEGWKPKRVLQNPFRQCDYSVRDWWIYFFKVLPLSTTVSSFPFFFLGRRGVVNNMEVGPCHRVVSVNKKLHFTSSPSTDMQQRRHTTRGNPEINPFLGEGERSGVLEYQHFPQFFQATETVICLDRVRALKTRSFGRNPEPGAWNCHRKSTTFCLIGGADKSWKKEQICPVQG